MKKKIFSVVICLMLACCIPLAGCFGGGSSQDTTYDSQAKIYDNHDKENVLNLEKDIKASGFDGAVLAKNGAQLTINGNKKVVGIEAQGYAMAVWSYGKFNANPTKITINGGKYEQIVTGTDTAYYLIYASDGGVIEINGGTFKAVTPQWTLNVRDFKDGVDLSRIIVKGGRFYKFNPSMAMTEQGWKEGTTHNFVADGYTVIQDGDWYEVVALNETTQKSFSQDGVLNLNGGSIADANDGAIKATGGNLTVVGKGAMVARETSTVEKAVAVWANNSNVVINDGTYSQKIVGDGQEYELIYAENNAKIVINGGTFKCATPSATLKTANGTILVSGGNFYKYDPTLYLANGFTTVKLGDWYKVIPTGSVVNLSLSSEEMGALVSEAGKGVVIVKDGIQMNIDGDGTLYTVEALRESIGVVAKGDGTKIVINGGNFEQKITGTYDAYKFICAEDTSVIEINGGTFRAATPNATFSVARDASVIIKGGRFYKFDPSAETNACGKLVAEGYEVQQDGDWYVVVKSQTAQA